MERIAEDKAKIILFEKLTAEVDGLLKFQENTPLGRKVSCLPNSETPSAAQSLAFLVEEFFQIYGDLSERSVKPLEDQPWVSMLNGIINEMHDLKTKAEEGNGNDNPVTKGTKKLQELVFLALDLHAASISDSQQRKTMENILASIKKTQSVFITPESQGIPARFWIVPQFLTPDWYKNLK